HVDVQANFLSKGHLEGYQSSRNARIKHAPPSPKQNPAYRLQKMQARQENLISREEPNRFDLAHINDAQPLT
mgnify:CR=1